jgi:von Willebrand factor type A domain
MKRLIGSIALAAAMFAAAPALPQEARSVSLVIDASGSMNAKLPDGQTRIDAAKKAVADLVSRMEPGTRLALRAYGHQSPTQKRDCKDTALLVGFAPLTSNRAEVVTQAQALQARGYTPITLALTAAAQDIASEESGERVVVLVSDGQETCASDPCVAARALAAADAKLVIHTIGFGVGAAARTQLQCIANVARGSYFDANSAAGLMSTLGKAAQAKAAEQKKTTTTVTVAKKTPSRILIKNTYVGASHPITRAEDGQQVANINGAVGHAEVPPGIYNVQFLNGVWRGVEVKPGETTVIAVGLLRIEGGSGDLEGYNVIEPETEEVLIRGRMISTIPLMPGRFDVRAGAIGWQGIEINAGQTTVVNPARIAVSGDKAGKYRVTTSDGREAGHVTRLFRLPLPAGSYIVDVEGQLLNVDLVDGQTHTINVQ